ncbi:hypothetical protein MMAGJ_05450 [Mycolicibacterium mageritense]|uniref:GIY-YIG nuclease family protein n=1 Tax=Mycolicibacterium mageritense TaxID=53462 RepID=A0ABM7HL92_MYCME|nr:hypothetical protein EB73_25605 [Mycobacterium sp. SWH-M3]BBX31263.1 hypothetical protein MMAGJ_05450 [Mycolicibacterium mageritense]CDO25011.1 hypothetical protein BN978_05511 [Mycolicibacterium mageritense DSM 44476 = CIP 104973]
MGPCEAAFSAAPRGFAPYAERVDAPFDEAACLDALEHGTPHRFGELRDAELSAGASVYTVWESRRLLFVGRTEPDTDGRKRPDSLERRLTYHAYGMRSRDIFSVHLCDRFIVPTLTEAQRRRLADGDSHLLDALTAAYVRNLCEYRFVAVPDGRSLQVHERVQVGALGAGKPLLNGR